MHLRFTLPLCILFLAMTGCLSNSPRFARAPRSVAPTGSTPAWVDNDAIPDGIAAVGVARPSSAGDRSQQRAAAAADARSKLAEKLRIRVRNLFTRLSLQVASAQLGAGPVPSEAMSRVRDDVTRHLLDQELPGVITRDTWTDPVDGSLYLLLVMPRDGLNVALASSTRAGIRREIAQGQTALEPVLPMVDQTVADSD
jgi:hypothetical protein